MLKYVNHDIVFQEIPDEVTLAINVSECPYACPECHSDYLRNDIGIPLTEESLENMILPYRHAITCCCFMGGDAEPDEVMRLAAFIKNKYDGKIKTGWYSGRKDFPENFIRHVFDYVKIGPYQNEKGSLKDRSTNQRLYHFLPNGSKEDITSHFWKQVEQEKSNGVKR